MPLRDLADSLLNRNENLKFIFKSPIQTPLGEFESLPNIISIDTTLQEVYNLTTRISENEIEDGSILSDHIHTLPQTLKIKGAISEAPLVVSNQPVNVPSQLLSGTVSGDFVRPVLGTLGKELTEEVTGYVSDEFLKSRGPRTQKRYWQSFLLKRFRDKQLFTVVTDVHRIENCFFEDITWDRKYQDGNALIFEATLRELRFVKSVVNHTPDAPQAQPTVRIGQTIKEVATGQISPIDAFQRFAPTIEAKANSLFNEETDRLLSKLPFSSQIRNLKNTYIPDVKATDLVKKVLGF